PRVSRSLSLHDALPISVLALSRCPPIELSGLSETPAAPDSRLLNSDRRRLGAAFHLFGRHLAPQLVREVDSLLDQHGLEGDDGRDRKSTRLNSSHVIIS